MSPPPFRMEPSRSPPRLRLLLFQPGMCIGVCCSTWIVVPEVRRWLDVVATEHGAMCDDGMIVEVLQGWIDEDRLLVASETALWVMDLESGDRDHVTALEADNPVTRSNDGRADPWGGFWIGTMGKAAEPGRSAIWRYYRGEMRRLFPGLTITSQIYLSFRLSKRNSIFPMLPFLAPKSLAGITLVLFITRQSPSFR